MSDLNLRVAEVLGYTFIQEDVYLNNRLVTVWKVVGPNGKKLQPEGMGIRKEECSRFLPDWENDILAAANFARSTGQMWELHDLRSEGYVAKFARGKHKTLAQNDNPATAICEATLKWYEGQKKS